jgi:hypothetical protein
MYARGDMTAYVRVSTIKKDGITVATKKTSYTVDAASLTTLDTALKLMTEIDKSVTKDKPDLFIHKNRDGSYAIATGIEPEKWPEDEKVIDTKPIDGIKTK